MHLWFNLNYHPKILVNGPRIPHEIPNQDLFNTKQGCLTHITHVRNDSRLAIQLVKAIHIVFQIVRSQLENTLLYNFYFFVVLIIILSSDRLLETCC
jgi:hypothetical protein